MYIECHVVAPAGLYFEKKKDFPDAFAFYAKCLNRCSDSITRDGSIVKDAVFQDLESETLLRMAMIKKEIGAWDDSWEICNRIFSTSSNSTLKANALCIKVHDVDKEIRDFI